MKMSDGPKGKKKSSAGISKADWKTMPRNKEGVITNDTIRKTRAKKAGTSVAKKTGYSRTSTMKATKVLKSEFKPKK